MSDPGQVGTEEMEERMYPSTAATFAKVSAIALAMLLVFNSQALVQWTHQPHGIEEFRLLQAPARTWHGWMKVLGTATLFEAVKKGVRPFVQPDGP